MTRKRGRMREEAWMKSDGVLYLYIIRPIGDE